MCRIIEGILFDSYNLLYPADKKYDNGFLNIYSNGRESSFFTFDIHSGRCSSICPSITKITGYDSLEYESKSIGYLRRMIHPKDYSAVVILVLNYIAVINEQKFNSTKKDNLEILPCRMRHRDGYWIGVNFYLLYLRNFPDKLIGLVQKTKSRENEIKPDNHISLREKEVLELIANGDSSKIIADKLSISETTVITHRKNLIHKLKVRNTAELIKEALKSGIIV